MNNERVFTDEQKQQLVLAYLYSRKGERVPTADIQSFLNACLETIVTAESVRMLADGLLLVQWDIVTGKFSFALNDAGVREAERLTEHA